jgi:5-formyltetrahydrofolate cyclo-ligase
VTNEVLRDTSLEGEALRAWRRAERERLVALRMDKAAAQIADWGRSIEAHVEQAFPMLHGGIVGFCWPYRNEYDARGLMRRVRDRGGRSALPVVIAPRMPLEFRVWQPGDALVEGVYGIPYPAAGEPVRPDVLLVPMNGFDAQGYRLGYGGGFFDRTLAALSPRPLAIGVAFECARIDTVHPQAHDIPMDWVVTERGAWPAPAAQRRNSR